MTTPNDYTPKPSWWQIVKSLFYDGGPSSTRFMFVVAGTCAGFTVIALASAFAWTYVRFHIADVVFGGVLTGIVTAFFGFAVNSHNLKHQVDAKEATSSTPITAVTTEK